ncbi:acyltransferase family protein [Williamsia deligens]|uniref:Acyltransferase family protein n=1 Tax=Williamsia deligens TaxID=321325 RepID=A0ABW3G482_9NOCA|nr:acyltransferase [Williamsia deligens]
MAHLDGVRAVAALYVLVDHALVTAGVAGRDGEYRGWEAAVFGWAQWGHSGVTVFIALAGFSLGLPVGRVGGLPDGLWGFLRRRARRIVPPYWIALTVTIVTSLVIVAWRGHADSRLPLTPTGWIADYLLLQDVIPVRDATYTLWSVSVEWHIYLVLPLLVVLWRRFGLAAAVAVCAGCGALGMLADAFVDDRFGRFYPEYYLVFAVSAGAAIALRRAPAVIDRIPLRAVAALSAVVVVAVWIAMPLRWIITNSPWLDVVVGVGVVALLCAMTTGRAPGLRAALSWTPLASVAAFSYSLYLIHAQLLTVLDLTVVTPLHLSPDVRLAMFWGLGCPLIVTAAWLFAKVAEKPFLPPPRVVPPP